VFGFENPDSYYWWNIGGWINSEHAIEPRVNGQSQGRLISTRGRIESDRWYDLRVELTPGRIRCFIDGELVHDYEKSLPEVRVSPTFDKSTGEVLAKIVNPGETPVSATIRLRGELKLASEGRLTTLAGAPYAVNTVESQAIEPKQAVVPVENPIRIELPATSVQVLRVKVK
jgi:alpha-L-arabinofuranosidase